VASRIEIKQVFLKLSGVGKENSFSVSTQRRAGKADEFTEASFEIRKYEEKYFGTYASHVNDRIQTGNYKEKGATIWGNSVFPGGFRSPSSLLCSASGTCGACSRGTSWSRPRRLLSWPLSLAGRACTRVCAVHASGRRRASSALLGFVAAAPAAAASDPVEARLAGLSTTAECVSPVCARYPR
jgi:hypothetical protein